MISARGRHRVHAKIATQDLRVFLPNQSGRRKLFPNAAPANVVAVVMRADLERTVLSVVRHDGAWAVEHDGEHFGHSSEKEVAKATAHKRAREVMSSGRACQVRVHGELGYYGA